MTHRVQEADDVAGEHVICWAEAIRDWNSLLEAGAHTCIRNLLHEDVRRIVLGC